MIRRRLDPFSVLVLLTSKEVKHLLDHLNGTIPLITDLLYGSGLRLLECLQLLVKDVNFARRDVFVPSPLVADVKPTANNDARRTSR